VANALTSLAKMRQSMDNVTVLAWCCRAITSYRCEDNAALDSDVTQGSGAAAADGGRPPAPPAGRNPAPRRTSAATSDGGQGSGNFQNSLSRIGTCVDAGGRASVGWSGLAAAAAAAAAGEVQGCTTVRKSKAAAAIEVGGYTTVKQSKAAASERGGYTTVKQTEVAAAERGGYTTVKQSEVAAAAPTAAAVSTRFEGSFDPHMNPVP
jgi:hypothetical protein